MPSPTNSFHLLTVLPRFSLLGTRLCRARNSIHFPTHVSNWLALVTVLLGSLFSVSYAEDTESASPLSADDLNYTFLYFENGLPTPYPHRRPNSEDNFAARANPDLVVQTGYYSLMLDCDDMQITGYDGLAGTGYLTDLEKDATVFTPAGFELSVIKDEVKYTCTGADVQTTTKQLVRLIESNRFVQRFDHLGLEFEDSNGNVLNDSGRLEVTAWADRLAIKLDFSGVAGVTETSVKVLSPQSIVHEKVVAGDSAVLAIQPHLDTTLAALNVHDYVTEATVRGSDLALNVEFDAAEFGVHIDIPSSAVSYPRDINRLDEFVIELTNPGSSAENIPLIFDQPTPRTITGTVMSLCQEVDGQPIGIPVQISKNWHRDAANPTVHQGRWLRGYTMLKLAAGETKRFRLRVIFGYWAGAGAVSHSQLSLIGWGKNWKWDESALGAWGESCTYDPTMHAAAAFMADVRPSFTTPFQSATDHNWTENSGGGDNLIYRDSNNTYRHVKRVKTAYRWVGPNMTEVLYSGVTDDDKIRYTYTANAVRTNDYHRRFHGYKYEFLDDVTSPKRLVFHQMAADYYSSPSFSQYYIGDQSGLLSSATASPGGNTYKQEPVLFNDRWLAINDTRTSNGYSTSSNRGILALSSTLNGSQLPLYLHSYGSSYGANSMVFDLSSASVTQSYAAGDVVEGEVEFIMPPKTSSLYWGADSELINRLDTYGTNTWETVHDESRYNISMDVTVNAGTLLRNYPLHIQAENNQPVAADFTIESGGIGHVPVVLQGLDQGVTLIAQRYTNGAWLDLESVDIADHAYFQGYLNPEGSMDYVFNLQRPTTNLADAWRVRFVTGATPEVWEEKLVAHWKLDDANGTHAADATANGFDGVIANGTWVTGNVGGALDFNGNNSRVSIPATAFESIYNELSIAMWVYGDTTQPRADSVFEAVDYSGNRILNIHIPWSDSKVYWDAGNLSSSCDRIYKLASASEVKGQWNHWVFTKNTVAGTMKIYLNGMLWHSDTGKTRAIRGVTDATFGSQMDSASYDGVMDDVRLYNFELSDAEVSNLYTGTSSGFTAWLALYPSLTNLTTQADPENDGIENLLEYVLDGDPTAVDNLILPALDTTEDHFVFNFTRRVDSSSDTVQVFQYSSNLTDWLDINITAPKADQVVLGPELEGLQTVTVTISMTSAEAGSIFGRLNVSPTN